MQETRGRPAKAEEDRREIRFQIRLSATELKMLEAAADERTSTWARKILLDAAAKRKRRKKAAANGRN